MYVPLTLANLLYDLPDKLGHIAYFIMLPMLLVVGIGYVLQRRLGLDNKTLTRLNFYFVVPGMVYYSVVTSPLSAGDAGRVIVFTLLVQGILGLVTLGVAKLRRIPADQINAALASTMFYNSGNYGMPLQDLALRRISLERGIDYSARGVGLQVVVVLVQNVTNFTLGVFMAASGKRDRHWRENLLQIVKFPPLYALAAALVTIQARRSMGPENARSVGEVLAPFWQVVHWLRDAFVPIALVTLGAQLATVRHHAVKYPVKMSVLLRLLGGPAIGLLLVWAVGAEGLLAQVLLISTGTPTAINAMLICMEMDNHPDYLARVVFYSTILSPLTLALVLLLAQSDVLPWMVIPP